MTDNNVYDLSDDDFASMDLSTFDESEEAAEELEDDSQEMPEDSEEEELEATEEDDDSENDDSESEEEDTETDEDIEEGDDVEPTTGTSEDNDDKIVTQEEEEVEDTSERDVNIKDSKDKPSKKSKTNDTLNADIESFYKTITAPFKANGKEITITNAEDAVALMQQGINYSKNMAELKPDKALLKTLKEHKLTDPQDISYLIDLHNKDPKAIAKLIRDSEIDLYEFDKEMADDYSPSHKVVQPTKLDDVVDELKTNASFGAVLDDITTGWDLESKQFVTGNPEVLKVLTQQKESGLYDKIVSAVEYEQMTGKAGNKPFIELYTTIEQQFIAKETPTSQESSKDKTSFKAPRPTSNKSSNTAKKRKASSPSTGAGTTKDTFNPLMVSDEDLMKSFK